MMPLLLLALQVYAATEMAVVLSPHENDKNSTPPFCLQEAALVASGEKARRGRYSTLLCRGCRDF
jgi:hypothetical protein